MKNKVLEAIVGIFLIAFFIWLVATVLGMFHI